jgi:precorrin-3B methylase
MSTASVAQQKGGAPMCYTRKDRELEKEARRITENRLMEEEAAIGMRTIIVVGESKKRRNP